MATKPEVQRDGDTWAIHWAEYGVAIGVERVKDRFDTLKAEVTAESTVAGRVIGPHNVDLLSTRSVSEFSNACAKRVNGLSPEVWHALMVFVCGRVAKDYRSPTPTVKLADVKDSGPVRYLIPQLIPTGETTVIYGDGESAKSMLALRIGYSVATGQDLPWGKPMPTTGNVLIVDWETNDETVAQRLRRIARGMMLPVPENIYYRQCFRSLTDELPNIREEISRKKIDLVIVDSIGFAASGALTEDDTARSSMNALRQMSPATRLVVAHVSKDAAQHGGPIKPFGSAFFWNGMRSGIEVRRSEEVASDTIIDVGLFHRKSNDGRHARPIGITVMFDQGESGTDIVFEPKSIEDVPDLAAKSPMQQRIRDMLRRGAMETTDILQRMPDVTEETLRKTLQRMPDVIQLHPGGGRGNPATWGLSSG
jgi:AAA domain